MGRTPNAHRPPVPAVDIPPENAAPYQAAQDASLSTAQADDVLAAGIGLGRLETLDFVSMVVNSAILPIYEQFKKSKAWKHLRTSDGRNFSSLNEFCEVKLGKSYTRLQELLANRNLIGQEAFEQAERIGLRQVDYNALKALPPPKQVIVREALTEGASKEEVQRALRELAAADQKEIEALITERDEAQAARDETKADLTAKDKVIARLKAQINKDKWEPPEPNEQTEALLQEVRLAEATACSWIEGALRQALAAVREHDEAAEGQSNHNAILSGYIQHIEDATDQLRQTFGLSRLEVLEDKDDPFAPLPAAQIEAIEQAMPKPINLSKGTKG